MANLPIVLMVALANQEEARANFFTGAFFVLRAPVLENYVLLKQMSRKNLGEFNDSVFMTAFLAAATGGRWNFSYHTDFCYLNCFT